MTVWDNLRDQIDLGSDGFIEEHAAASATVREIPRAQRPVGRPPLSAVVSGSKDGAGIAQAYLEHGYTQH